MSEKVFVGLSGGVDSAVSAALLKQEGYDVVGAFIKIWSPEFTECTWQEDRLDAMRICAALDIPFREIDLSQEYLEEVVLDMTSAYKKGITPNPDVLCNRTIKFGHFARWALSQGAQKIATGHYARIRRSGEHFELLRGGDQNKDQSYFLYQLAESDLAHTLFPVGAYTKTHVRELAKRFDLPVAKKRDSQGLCFVGDISLREFLSKFIEFSPGEVVDANGNVIGTHEGAALVTIGQRHGFSAGATKPLYVVGIDIERNLVRVSERREDAARRSSTLSQTYWVSSISKVPSNSLAQARYRELPFAVSLEGSIENPAVTFQEPHIAAPGQSLVFYEGEKCLGGGIINNS